MTNALVYWLLSAFLITNGAGPRVVERKFAVLKGNDEVGTLIVRRTENTPRVTFTLESDVDLSLIMSIAIKESIRDVFEDGHLVQSLHTRHVNNNLKTRHVLEKINRTYRITDEDQAVSYLSNDITATVVSIYFHEPPGTQSVYSQNFKQMVSMRKTGAHTFSISLPNGNKALYEYQGGFITRVVSHTTVGQVTFLYKGPAFQRP